MTNAYKFSQMKNNIVDADMKETSFVTEDLMTRYFQAKSKINDAVKEKINKAFSGTGVFETVSEKRENDSMELMNRKITFAIFSKSINQYDPNYKISFDKDLIPDEATKNLMKNPNIWKDPIFRSRFMTNYETAISPAAQAIAVGFYDDMAEIHHVGWGDNKAFNVKSNEVFVVTELGQDTLKVAKQSLFGKDYVATPKPHGAGVSINFYDMACGKLDWAEHIMRIAKGFANRWNLMAIQSLYNYISDQTTAFTVDTPFFKHTLNDTNWNAIVKAVATANSDNLIKAYGDLSAITQILPATAVATMNAALATLIGKEWVVNGYVGEYHGASVHKLDQMFLPGTINTSNATAYFAAPEDLIYFVNEGVKPLHLVFEGEGLYVDRSYIETGDTTITYAVVSNFDMIYVPGDKIGAIYL